LSKKWGYCRNYACIQYTEHACNSNTLAVTMLISLSDIAAASDIVDDDQEEEEQMTDDDDSGQ